MNPFRYRAIVEGGDQILNPLSPWKLRRLVDYLGLADGDRVIDVGCGKGWLLAEMSRARRIQAIGLEINPAFAALARRELAAFGDSRIIDGPALDYPLERGSFDVALCIGATFALDGLERSIDWLASAVRPGGRVAIGEPFALRPFPPDMATRRLEYDRTQAEVADLMAAGGLALTGLVASSLDDWDHYESRHWRATADWLRAHPDDPDARWLAETNAGHRQHYLAEQRDCLGWAVFVAERVG
ncbi:MAG TPA: class I SAM-dependent methyltransferase [Caulobacteraceae bacterium]